MYSGHHPLPSRRDVLSDVSRVVAEQLDVDLKDVQPSSKLIEDLGADSLAIVELVLCFQEEFDLDVPDEDVERIVTVQDIVTFIEKCQTKEQT